MRPQFGQVLADAAAMWRGERELLIAVAGVFFFVPMLGIVLLLGTIDIGKDVTPEQFRDTLVAFQTANIVPIFLASLLLDFGTFAVLNLLLQGGGRTLGKVLALTGLRFLPFVVISIIAGMTTSLGLSLFLLPGMFIFARTWLVAPSYAAAPERGLLSAFLDGWRSSGGIVWLTILGAVILTLIPMLVAAIFIASLVTGLAVLAGVGEASATLGNVVIALVGAGVWAWLAVLRVAFYRALLPNTGT